MYFNQYIPAKLPAATAAAGAGSYPNPAPWRWTRQFLFDPKTGEIMSPKASESTLAKK